jgi:hypothetical protein
MVRQTNGKLIVPLGKDGRELKISFKNSLFQISASKSH